MASAASRPGPATATLARQRWQGPRPEPIADGPLSLDADDDIPLARVRLAAVAGVDRRGATAEVAHFGVFLDESAVRWVTVPLAGAGLDARLSVPRATRASGDRRSDR